MFFLVGLVLLPACLGFTFPDDWEMIKRSMRDRQREQELQVRDRQREQELKVITDRGSRSCR
jgi:uncharacterized protein (DUF2225 family)